MRTEQTQAPRDGWFMRLAGAIGDLGHPFYDEERQRDVWNEASAVGFQLMLLLGLAAATAMVWLGGVTALPYAVTVVCLIGFASVVTLAYTHLLGVRPDELEVLRIRLVPYAVLIVLFVVGVYRAAPDGEGPAASFAKGVAQGAVLAVLGLLVAGVVARRRRR